MGLEAVFEAIAERLPADLLVLGPDRAEEQTEPPRIIWVPTTTSYTPAKGISGGPGDEGMLAVREVTVRVRIWGRSLEEAETLLESFANAVEPLFGRPGYRLISETWKTGGALSQGVEVELLVVLRRPLLRALKPTRAIEEIRPTYKLNETAV